MNYLIKQKEIEILQIELKIRKLELEILKDCDYEFFLPVDGYDNYFISNFGNVKNNNTNKIISNRVITDKDIKKLDSLKMEIEKCF